jgi:alkylhydroperoxidase/carboxymuconolactone decarboxylase family protein YurZ
MDTDRDKENQSLNIYNMFYVYLQQKITVMFYNGLVILQVSLRDPLRNGAEDHELREIIGAAVCISDFLLLRFRISL